jgi:hypothetical protein
MPRKIEIDNAPINIDYYLITGSAARAAREDLTPLCPVLKGPL